MNITNETSTTLAQQLQPLLEAACGASLALTEAVEWHGPLMRVRETRLERGGMWSGDWGPWIHVDATRAAADLTQRTVDLMSTQWLAKAYVGWGPEVELKFKEAAAAVDTTVLPEELVRATLEPWQKRLTRLAQEGLKAGRSPEDVLASLRRTLSSPSRPKKH